MGRIFIRSRRKFLKRVGTVLWNRNDLLRFRFRSYFGPIQTYLAQIFNNKKFVKNLAFSMIEAAMFPEKLGLYFLIF
jgi:hypothetical protein